MKQLVIGWIVIALTLYAVYSCVQVVTTYGGIQ